MKASRHFLVLGSYVVSLLLVVIAFVLAQNTFTEANAASGGVFKLRDISVFDANNEKFLRGQMCRCQDKPFAEVKNYPAFASKAPIFGSVKFDGRSDDTNSGATFYFAVDESRGMGKGYDRLYFDANRDLDLRNDPVAKVQSNPPDHGYAPHFSGIKAKASYDFLKLNLATSDNAKPVEVMPRLLLTGDETNTYRFMFFVRTHFFEGDIKVAGEKFHAQLGNDYVISDLNSPSAALILSQGEKTFDWGGWGGNRIAAMQKIKGQFYRFSASPDGELTVRPYAGDLGTFEIGAGGRALTNLTAWGSFDSRDWAVPAGGDIKDGVPAKVNSCQVPVGDYLPEYVSLSFGRLAIGFSQNYHSEGKRQSRDGRPNVYGITIRKDQPFVLDFANQPEVMFTSPTNSQRIKPGDTLLVAAVLVDPKLDIMIRRLEDTSRKQTKDAEGKPLGYERNLSLDPTVIITRTNGEKVAEGVMPFG